MNTFTPYTFGSMSLGRKPEEISSDLAVVRRAMDAGVWFHSSPTYNQGFTFMVLRLAFDAERSRVPRMMIKIRDGSAQLMRFEVEDSCRRLGLDFIDVAQLVSMDPHPGNLVDQLRGGGGPIADELSSLRERGLIRQTALYLTEQNSDAAIEAVQSKLIDGVILYWNACQRNCSDGAWERIQKEKIPVLALRTLGGGPSDKQSSTKAESLEKLIKDSACRNATDFALNLAASESVIQTTIGGTASLTHLEEYLSAAAQATPLTPQLKQRSEKLQRD